MKTFPGPNVGIYDERRRLNKWGRPLLGGTVKPKLGLSAKDYATIIYECLAGGLDTTKDDENMNSQPFNRWRDRFRYGIDAVNKAEAETGEAKGHFFNVTAASTEEALRRLEYIAAQGSRYIMYDFLTAGFAASADVFKRAGELGSSSTATAPCTPSSRARRTTASTCASWPSGCDWWAAITCTPAPSSANSKARGRRPWASSTCSASAALRRRPPRGLYFEQDFAGLKSVWPVASGGIHVLNIPDLYAIYGNDAFWLFGGGTHGHPQGQPRRGPRQPRRHRGGRRRQDAGARRRQNCPELREAMELWGNVKFSVSA